MAILNISRTHWTPATMWFSLSYMHYRLNLTGNGSPLPRFIPQRAGFFQAGAVSSYVLLFGMRCPDAAWSTQMLWTKDNFDTVMSGRKSSCHLSETHVEGVTSGFLLPGMGVSAVFIASLIFPQQMRWWWLVNPPEKILLNSKLSLCC